MNCPNLNCQHWVEEYNRIQIWMVQNKLWERYMSEKENDKPSYEELQTRLSTLLKASEGMEKALEDIKYHADNPFASKNGEINRKWLAYCQDVAIKALADFRAVKESK